MILRGLLSVVSGLVRLLSIDLSSGRCESILVSLFVLSVVNVVFSGVSILVRFFSLKLVRDVFFLILVNRFVI